MALQHQFALAAQNDAQLRRSRHNSLRDGSSSSDDVHTAASSSSHLGHTQYNTAIENEQDELEEIVEPESAYDVDPAATHDAIRDIRNQQLESLQSIVHSIAEAHFDSETPDAETTQILDDMFASLRRIGGHNAPLSPTFARPSGLGLSFNQITDVDRLVLLVDRLSLAVGNVNDAKEAGLLANLTTLTHGLVESDRRMARVAALESPPRTPRTLNWTDASLRRRSSIQQQQHSPQSSSSMSAPRGSWSSFGSHATLSTSSDEAAHNADKELRSRDAPSPRSKRSDKLAEAAVLSAVPEQQHVDGSVFDMATVRQSSATPNSTAFSLESLYTPQPSSSQMVDHQSPRSDQVSNAASVGDRSDSTALPNRKHSTKTESVASTSLPGYSFDVPGYETQDTLKKAPEPQDDLPEYDEASAAFATDTKKPIETLTILERRRAKLAAQHSAYAARTPEDLAMVQSSIDRLSTVMPQLDNQRALSPEEHREASLQQMIGRLAASTSKRLNDQRSDPPSFKPSRPAPSPRVEVEQAPPVPPKTESIGQEMSRKASIVSEPEMLELQTTPSTPVSLHSGAGSTSSSRRTSLLPGAFGRKISIASIGNALRRASIYDTSKVKPKEAPEPTRTSSPLVSDLGTNRRRAATHDSRKRSDIAEGLASLFNEGTPRINGATDVTSKADKRKSFRAIDFADDTPRGRESYLGPSIEMEGDDTMDDYTFATIDTTKSNHRLSVLPAMDSPNSPVSWTSSRVSSPRSSQLISSNPSTPTWPKSPLTPISPVAPKSHKKPVISFAADTLKAPTSGRSRAASLQSQMREQGLSPLRRGKFNADCDDVSVSAAAAAIAAAAELGSNDVVCYTAAVTSNIAADTTASVSTCTTTDQAEARHIELEFLAEAQPSLGSISVMLWATANKQAKEEVVELEYGLVDDVHGESRMLQITPSEGSNVSLTIAASGVSSESGSSANMSSSSGSSGSKAERTQDRDHVSSNGISIPLPSAAVFPQSGTLHLPLDGSVCRLKLSLTPAERRLGAEESRSEGMVEFPLSAAQLSSIESLSCAVCASSSGLNVSGVTWRALPSEGWEELVDAWMCHGDQELNRSLTETAVKFASKVTKEETQEGWVGDSYLLLPQSAVKGSFLEGDGIVSIVAP